MKSLKPMKITIPKTTLETWQKIVDTMAEVTGVPTALIKRVESPYIKILCSSKTNNNPYKVNSKKRLLYSGLYCETVIKTKKKAYGCGCSKKWELEQEP